MVGWVLAGLVLGILSAELFPPLTAGALGLGLGMLAYCLIRKKELALLLVFLLLGVATTTLRLNALWDPAGTYGQDMEFTVRSSRLVQTGEDFVWMGEVIEPKELAGASLRVHTDTYSPGEYVLRGRLNPPVNYRNPGQGWHYKRKLYAGEIGTVYAHVRDYQPIQPGFFATMASRFRENILENLGSGEGASLALAITTGDRSMLSSGLKSSVYLTGVGHTMALSGLHVSILAGLVMGMLRRVGLERGVAQVIAIVVLIGYTALVGPSPSLIRAVLMSAYAVMAFLTGREGQGMLGLQWAGFVMLLFNPLWLFDYAFVYSFLASFICLTSGGRLEKLFSFLPEAIRPVASLTLVIQLIALPLNAYLFGGIPLWAPVANMVVIPLLPLLTALALLAGVTSGLVGTIISFPAVALLDGIAAFIQLLGQFPFQLTLGGIALAVVVGISLGVLFYICLGSRRGLAIILVLSVALIPLNALWQEVVSTVWFLDVGQGDAILLRHRGEWMLVDCGESYAATAAVVPTLKHLGVRKLSYLVVTHPDSDHAAGLQSVLDNFSVDTLLVNCDFSSTQWTEVVSDYRVINSEVVLEKGIQILFHGRPGQAINDNSLLVSLKLGEIGLLLTGDIEAQGEKLYIPKLTSHQILKVAHHGSGTSTSQSFLQRVQPETAIISCGLGNRFGFPAYTVLDNLAEAGVRVHRTDLNGCIRVHIWPWNKYTISTFWGETNG